MERSNTTTRAPDGATLPTSWALVWLDEDPLDGDGVAKTVGDFDENEFAACITVPDDPDEGFWLWEGQVTRPADEQREGPTFEGTWRRPTSDELKAISKNTDVTIASVLSQLIDLAAKWEEVAAIALGKSKIKRMSEVEREICRAASDCAIHCAGQLRDVIGVARVLDEREEQ